MANVKNNSAAQETRRRLLAAAGEVFAAHGFHAATIKDITDRAHASLASVNYHFQDKAELYAAVLRRIEEDAMASLLLPGPLVGTPAEQLRQVIAHLCQTMVCRNRPAWEQVLMAREVAEPSPALDGIVDHVLRPLHDQISGIIAALLKVSPAEPMLALHVASVVGQVFYYSKRAKLMSRIHPPLAEVLTTRVVADHIADFSLAALGVKQPARRPATPRAGRPKRRARPPRHAQLSK